MKYRTPFGDSRHRVLEATEPSEVAAAIREAGMEVIEIQPIAGSEVKPKVNVPRAIWRVIRLPVIAVGILIGTVAAFALDGATGGWVISAPLAAIGGLMSLAGLLISLAAVALILTSPFWLFGFLYRIANKK